MLERSARERHAGERRAPRRILITFLLSLGATAATACDGTSASPMGTDADGGAPQQLETGRHYRVVRGRGADKGKEVPPETLFAAAAAADVACLGEQHDDDQHHAAQKLVLDAMVARAAKGGRSLAVGLEMVQRPFQAAADAFAAGTITEAEFEKQAQWRARWGYDIAYYHSLLQEVQMARLALLALNAATELTAKVGKEGLDSLSAADRAMLPPLDLQNADHRAWFRAAIDDGSHDLTANFEQFYAVQVIWDSTMADTALTWQKARPGRQVAVLAGFNHCIDLGIPFRLRSRGLDAVVSVRAVLDDEMSLAPLLREGLFDFLVVYAPEIRPPRG